jgi:RNA polymerase sigma-70 factor (ECF subfamily)
MQRDLVELARAGDHAAFEALAAASIDRLYAAARLILRDARSADDATQDALVAAWRGIRGLRDPARFDAWLHRLLVRACHRHRSGERRRRVTELRLLPADHDRGTRPDGELSVVIRDQLDRGFERLTHEQRAVLVLHHYLGLALWEVAEALEVPIGTVKSRLHRATSAMRAALEADDRDPSGRPAADPDARGRSA